MDSTVPSTNSNLTSELKKVNTEELLRGARMYTVLVVFRVLSGLSALSAVREDATRRDADLAKVKSRRKKHLIQRCQQKRISN